ncbi:hypothetical protein WAB17_10615 [Parerythrobacter aurantius]|uniref:hypothetical protein n=1 Tax=Parerythrobacter aurantius TaxID=3127706 RepID=UPI003254C3D8
MKYAVVLAMLASAGSPATANGIKRFESLPASQSEEAVALVQDLFASINQLGVEKTMAARFPNSKEAEGMSLQQVYRTFDTSCGPISETELIREQPFGSMVLEQTYVTRMGDCIVKWDIVLERQDGQWTFNWLNFNTLTGNRWEM